jgi:hypothetical protein
LTIAVDRCAGWMPIKSGTDFILSAILHAT